MPSSNIERKLAAIMFTDIAGYTEQMSKSESKSLDTLEKKRSILKPLLKEYKGTFVKEIGDGTLSYFESAVNAATCAVKLQETTYDDKDMNIRVGIHIGDIVFKDGDIFGGGVNVASRLESIAPKGGICVSKNVYDELLNQDDFDGVELGLQSLKGVGRLIEVFGLKGEKLNQPDPKKYQDNKIAVHSDDEVPSIAIIPFRNKGKEEDAFFAYGISEDLISNVTSAGLIRVASKKQIEDAGDIPQDELAKKLNARYMANGELWRMRDMFQLSVELYDTKDEKVIWSDRWEEKWDNLPTIKVNLSDGLLKSLNITCEEEKKTEIANVEAYEYYLRAKYVWQTIKNKEDLLIVRQLLNKAVELDTNLIAPRLTLGFTYFFHGEYDKSLKIYQDALKIAEINNNKIDIGIIYLRLVMVYSHLIGGFQYPNIDKDEIVSYLNKARIIIMDSDDISAKAQLMHSFGNYYNNQFNIEKGLSYILKSIEFHKQINSDYGVGLYIVGEKNLFMGHYDKALKFLNSSKEYFEKQDNRMRLSYINGVLGEYYLQNSYFEKAITYYEKELEYWINRGHDTKIYAEVRLNTSIAFAKSKLNLDYDKNSLEKIMDRYYKYMRKNNLKPVGDIAVSLKLYHLLENNEYLELAYNEVQEKADKLEPDVAAKFLSYPIPKAIVEEWEKIN